MKLSKQHIAYLIIFVIVIIPFLPIKVRYKFESMARVYPEKEWLILRNTDGSFTSQIRHYTSNAITGLTNFNFERGDVATISLKDNVTNNSIIREGDSVAYIYSHFIENEILKLQNLRDIDLAELEVALSGEKQSVIDEALQTYKLAQEQYDLQLKNLARQQQLYNDTVITISEFEIHQNLFNQAKINLDLTYNSLLSVKTGMKPSEVQLISERVKSYEKEIDALIRQKTTYHLISPLTGMLIYNNVMEEVLKVSDTTNYLLKIPVQLEDMRFLTKISSISFEIPGQKVKVKARHIDTEMNVNLYIGSNSQAVMAKALVENDVRGLKPGMFVNCTVYCDKITLFEMFKRGLKINY